MTEAKRKSSFSAGVPVEIPQIERELKKLWQEGGDGMTRASLINLAVFSDAKDSLAQNTELIARLSEDHAFRALVVAADSSAKSEAPAAWIAAHCHVSRAGSKKICSEQISFALSGAMMELLPALLFAHLESDLPFHLWWQSDLPKEIDPHFWKRVDRLYYDSASWKNFDRQMRLAASARDVADERLVLCDLNWTRLIHFRLALAQFFDHTVSLEKLAEIQRVELEHAPGFRSTALLLLGWLSAQLGWTISDVNDESAWLFADCSGEPITISLQEKSGAPISSCRLFAGANEFRVEQLERSEFLTATRGHESQARLRQFLPAGDGEIVALMNEELMRGGPHHIYLRAVQAVRELL